MKHLLLIAAVTLSSPVLAQEAPAPQPGVEAPAAEPARLAAAQAVVDKLFPTGTYARIMNGTMDTVMKGAMASVGELPLKDLAGIGGVPEEQLKQMGDGKLKEMLAILDPAFDQRMAASMRAMMPELTKLMTQFEPGIREGLTAAYARRYTPEQLAEMGQFFSTPTGSLYASESMVIFMDPEVVNRMMGMIPEMTKQMPTVMGSVERAIASLPKPKSLEDLTKTERTRLAALLGVSEAELIKRNKTDKRR
ncbi:DUF2059 domain-containing protein [Novosphingobium ginsenosidimutans]|uniref:DUF2059 domain-containing protein n=1 Tax=Novosphingobium ginsenosidimutans TaxID=1176536 RepID=A0A5B8S5J7_9SPHN|nr:DUF2059 domain-containing protein [Novosphingobium ginsenosidimutans]QEA16859.1 DUF2059 domain-containing protein [Novosphingobium ginsenosidimutans]